MSPSTCAAYFPRRCVAIDERMTPFTQYTMDTVPEASKQQLARAKQVWGFVPTLHASLAESPVALEAYNALLDLMGKSSLTPIEQQIALLTISVFHGCEYCTMGHTYLARTVKAPETAIQAVRDGQPIPDRRLQTLRAFVEVMVRERGRLPAGVTDEFIAAGFTRANVLEVIVAIATKTISNYTNHIVDTPKESFMSDPALRWTASR